MVNLNSKKICLAGSTGMVGHAILNYLLKSFSDVSIKASYHERLEPMVQNGRTEYIYADLRDSKCCELLARGCDYAIFAAAKVGGAAAVRSEPSRYVTDNLIMAARFLEACHSEKIKRIVFIGSSTLYQDMDRPISEEMLNFNQDPPDSFFGFGWVSRYLEKLCEFWHKFYGLEIILVRAPNIFGPYDRFNFETSNFIPALIRKADEKHDPFEVWGFPEVTRDVLYVEDLARGVVELLCQDEIKWDIFNMGMGKGTTVSQVANCVIEISAHKPSRVSYLSSKPTTMKYRVLDCSKIEKKIGWKPKVNLEEGIRSTTDWWNRNKATWQK